MKCTFVVFASFLLVILTGCDKHSGYRVLFAPEQQQLEEQTKKLTEWAQELTAVVADNDSDLAIALALVEAEQERELLSSETDQFSLVQDRIQTRSTTISELFDQGNEMQIELFAQIYQYLGKLESGASHCGIDPNNFGDDDLVGLPDAAAWPQFKQSYLSAYEAGQTFLNETKTYPCEALVPAYPALRQGINDRLRQINRLLESLSA